MSKKRKRRSASVKEQAVMRLFRGEDMELVSRETGYTMHELKQWRDQYMLGGKESLKSHPKDVRDKAVEQRDQLIARQALEIEILKKAKAITEGRR
jgi:transposase-like protein